MLNMAGKYRRFIETPLTDLSQCIYIEAPTNPNPQSHKATTSANNMWAKTLILCCLALGLALPTLAEVGWWRTAQFYQIYPRSYKDSDGDGVGDLNGKFQSGLFERGTLVANLEVTLLRRHYPTTGLSKGDWRHSHMVVTHFHLTHG